MIFILAILLFKHCPYAELAALYLVEPNKDVQKAFRLASKAVELDPNYARGFYVLANVFLVGNNFPDSKKNYEKAVELDPSLSDPETDKIFIEKGLM